MRGRGEQISDGLAGKRKGHRPEGNPFNYGLGPGICHLFARKGILRHFHYYFFLKEHNANAADLVLLMDIKLFYEKPAAFTKHLSSIGHLYHVDAKVSIIK